ncbi:tetratricopeptide repeat protein [Mycobacterium sp.]|uniref:tetratricopeptide repeat protein n=1 Tax=Mycobacterium sp. TaxID=1785 RepID=UPI003BB21A88
MAVAEPIIVVLGPWCGGTSAVAKVLHHLGVFMGTRFDVGVRELDDTWEDSDLSQLCRRAFSEPGGQLQMDARTLKAKLRSWADNHRRAAHIAERRPGVKHPVLCVAVDRIRDAWGPVVPVVVDRPAANIVASLNRLGWWKDEQERAESTAQLIAARDLSLAGVATVRVDFEALRSTPAVVIRRLADELGLEITDAQFETAVSSVVPQADVPREVDPHQRLIDRFLLQAESNPDDPLPVHMLAQIYFNIEDFINASRYSERLIEIGAEDEDIFLAMLRIAQSLEKLDTPWLEVQNAYMQAWEFRPTRAEPFYGIARHYSAEKRYRLGYLFAERAVQIPLPADDIIIHDPAIYAWRAIDEQAVCASGIGNHHEAFILCRRLLARPDIPDDDRKRIAANRDVSVPAMLEATSSYPEVLVRNLSLRPRNEAVTVSMIAGPNWGTTAVTLNSFLHCCLDVAQVGRFLVFDDGRSPEERAILHQRYAFLEFVEGAVGAELREHVRGRHWLHLDHGWQFFAPDSYIARLTAILDAESRVFQVGINLADATKLNGASAPEKTVRRTPDGGRYVLTGLMADGPAMFDTERLDRADSTAATATLDEVLCINCLD